MHFKHQTDHLKGTVGDCTPVTRGRWAVPYTGVRDWMIVQPFTSLYRHIHKTMGPQTRISPTLLVPAVICALSPALVHQQTSQ